MQSNKHYILHQHLLNVGGGYNVICDILHVQVAYGSLTNIRIISYQKRIKSTRINHSTCHRKWAK